MNKKIIYIGGELPDKEASALRIMANAKALQSYGFDILLIGQRKGLSKKEMIIESYGEMKAFLLPMPKTIHSWIKELISISSFRKIIEEESNICAIVMYNPHAIVFERMRRFCKSKGIKIIADCTEWHTVHHLSGLKKYVKLLDITCRIRISQKKADGIIAISSYFDKFYKKYCKTVIVPPLVDLEEDKWKVSDNQNKQRKFVYAGRMGIGKDSLNSCVRAFENFSDEQFILDIVGVSYEEYVTQFPEDISLIKKLGSKIIFHGQVSHREALEYVKNASFSFLIRVNNRKNDSGFPTKFVESIGCGTPVIATDFSDVKRYILENKIGIMVDNIEKLENEIYQIFNMTEKEMDNLKYNCKIFEGFDYHMYSDKLGLFLDSVCNGGNDANR